MTQSMLRLIAVAPFVVLGAALSTAATCYRQEQAPPPATQASATQPAQPSPVVTGIPTLLPPGTSVYGGGVAEDAGQAVGFAREHLQYCPPLCPDAVRIDSVVYVETTVGGAKVLPPSSDGLWDPAANVGGWGAPDDAVLWVVIAHGRFQEWYMGSADHYGPVYDSAWIIVPKGRQGTFWFESNTDYDLSQLGTVHEVTLPLPRFPTPVSLSES